MKLSIITINYNNLEGLKKTYESVVCQTWTDYEWIIIDGGSTDGSKEFIETIAESPSLRERVGERLYWCSEPDKGVYNAQNKGLSHAAGEYVIFMNSGDVFAYSNTLNLVFERDRKSDIIYGYMMRKTLDGVPHNMPSMKSKLYWEDFFFDTIPHQSSYIRRSLFEKLGLYDETYPRLADWKWFQNAIAFHDVSVEFIPHKLSVYECGGISEDDHWRDDLYRLRKEMFPKCIPDDDYENLRDLHKIMEFPCTKFLYRVIRKMMRWHFEKKQKKEFRRVRYGE